MNREQQILNDPQCAAYTDKQRGWINEAFFDGVNWADQHPDKSIINWQTGEPKEEGHYLVTLNNKSVTSDSWLKYGLGWAYFPKSVTAWCKLSDVKPYEEEME